MESTLRSRATGLVVLVLGILVTGLGAVAGATTTAPGQPRVYVPDARTIVEIDGDKVGGWTVHYYDHSTRTVPGEEAARTRCAEFRRVPKQVRCGAIVNQRNRDFRAMQQGLAYAHALADD